MANEISASASLTVRKGNLSSARSVGRTFSLASSAPAKAAGIQSIGTTEEAVVMGDVAAQGWALFENLDATNYLTIGIMVTATYYPVLKLAAGEFALCRLSTNVIYAKANAAACQLNYEIYDA